MTSRVHLDDMYSESGLVPDLLSTFDPEGVLEVFFGDQKLAIGSAKPQSGETFSSRLMAEETRNRS